MPDRSDAAPDPFAARMDARSVAPLWAVMAGLVRPEPPRTCAPFAWRYADMAPLLDEAAEAVPPEQAERRVLILENPDLRGTSAATQSLYAGLQVVRPDERAPPHRHSQAALRFCFDSDGAYTMVDDRRIAMAPFDLVLTPPFTWHEHGNPGARNAVWLDGLDIPIVRFFATEHAEHGPGVSANARGDAASYAYGRALRPLDPDGAVPPRRRGTGIVHYRFADWRPALSAALEADGGDTAVLEFLDPETGGPAMPTLAAFARIVRAGAEAAPRRSTESQVLVVVEGAGTLHVDEAAFALEPRTVAVAPPWSRLSVRAQAETVLFGFSDRAAQQALGLWRLEGDGR